MAQHIQRQWPPSFHGTSRRDRRGCQYAAYLPDPLVGWDPSITADVVADLADAEQSIMALNQQGVALTSLEGIARFLMRSESVASSHIEGLSIGIRRMARAEARVALGGPANDLLAALVLANVTSMEAAIELGSGSQVLELADLLALHELLLLGSAPGIAGVVRDEQNWIGGSSYNPCSAAFVPPPPEHLSELLTDLLVYMNGDAHSPLVQAALVHAQLETLHPFADGNGRAGRALIHVVLRRRGLAPSFVPPISMVLATRSRDYIAGLSTFRHLGPPDGEARSAGACEWLRTFATATRRACLDALDYAAALEVLQVRWRARLGGVRANSGTDLLLRALPGLPVFTTATAAARIGRSTARTTDAVNALATAGILQQRNLGKQRYRVFEVPDVMELYTVLERALAEG